MGVVEARRSMAAACNAAAERYRAAIRSLHAGARDSTDTSSSFTAGDHAHSCPCLCCTDTSSSFTAGGHAHSCPWLCCIKSSVRVLACTMSQHWIRSAVADQLVSAARCRHTPTACSALLCSHSAAELQLPSCQMSESQVPAEGSELNMEMDEAFIPAARLPTAASYRLKQPLGGPGVGMHPPGPLLGSHAAAAPYMEPAWQSMHMPGGSAQQAWLQQAADKTHIRSMPGGQGVAAVHETAAGQYGGFPAPVKEGVGRQQPAGTRQAYVGPEREIPAQPLRPAQAPRELQQLATPAEPAACSEHEAWGTLGRERSSIDALLQAAPAKPVLGPASQVVSQAGSRYNAAELSDDGDPLAVEPQPGPAQRPAGSWRHTSEDRFVQMVAPEVHPAVAGSTGLQPGPLQARGPASAVDVHQAKLHGGHQPGVAPLGREPAEPAEDQDARHAQMPAPRAAGAGMLQEPSVPAESPGEQDGRHAHVPATGDAGPGRPQEHSMPVEPAGEQGRPVQAGMLQEHSAPAHTAGPPALGHLLPLSRPPMAALPPALPAPATTSQQVQPAAADGFSKALTADQVSSEQAPAAGRSLPEQTPADGTDGIPGTVIGASASEAAAASSIPADHVSRQGAPVLQADHPNAQTFQATAAAAESGGPGRLLAGGSSLKAEDIRVAPAEPGAEAQARPDGGQAALPQLRAPVGASPGHAADRAAAVAQLHPGERGLPGPAVPSVARQLQFQQPGDAAAAPHLLAGAALPTATASPASDVAQQRSAVGVAAAPSAAEGSEAQLELAGELSQATAADTAAAKGSGALSERRLAGDTSGRHLGEWPALPGVEAPAGALVEAQAPTSEGTSAAGVVPDVAAAALAAAEGQPAAASLGMLLSSGPPAGPAVESRVGQSRGTAEPHSASLAAAHAAPVSTAAASPASAATAGAAQPSDQQHEPQRPPTTASALPELVQHRLEVPAALPKSVQPSLEGPPSLPASQPMTTRPLAEQAGTPLEERVLQPGSPDGAHLVAVLEQHAREQQGVLQLGQLVREQGGAPPGRSQLGVNQVGCLRWVATCVTVDCKRHMQHTSVTTSVQPWCPHHLRLCTKRAGGSVSGECAPAHSGCSMHLLLAAGSWERTRAALL